ncbi:hypothetical protein KCP78_02475 [Salmonella enterica subsp. enterica]|nr:hypothetical protein KCP78_02475 [Salmonella enterica subsp. enterica]
MPTLAGLALEKANCCRTARMHPEWPRSLTVSLRLAREYASLTGIGLFRSNDMPLHAR